MRRILISLVLLTLFVLFGGPAIADDDPGNPGDQSSSSATDQANGDDPSEDSENDAAGEDENAPAPDNESGPSDEPAQEATAAPVAGDEPGTESHAATGDPAGGEGSEVKDSGSEPSSEATSNADGDEPAPDPSLKDASEPMSGSIVICHATADSNTFSEESVSADATADGHDADGGDVIPPFDHADGTYEGKNYDDVGKALLQAHCNAAEVPVEPQVLAEERLERTLVALAAVAPNVTICHATNSSTNPYDVISPAAEGAVNGHAGHTGPVFQAGATSWGDIIPPFNDINHTSFGGLNWTAEGQAIYNNGCNPVAAPAVAPVAPDRVTICHATGGNDFVTLSVVANGTAEGHTAHFRDIIPPFTFGDITFGGLNWDDDAADFLHDGCRHHHHHHHHKGHHHDRRAGALPNTGGPSLWPLLLAFMLVAGGVTLVDNHRLGLNGRLATTAGVPEPLAWSGLLQRQSSRRRETDPHDPGANATHPSPSLPSDETDALADVRHWKGATAIALAFAAAAIAIRRSLR
ncbi:MAG: hypothetical protein ACJ71Z_06295 [Aeromicrobium sp.]